MCTKMIAHMPHHDRTIRRTPDARFARHHHTTCFQRLICSQCMFVAGFLLPMFKQMTGFDKKSKRMAVGGPLIGIIGAGGQLG